MWSQYSQQRRNQGQNSNPSQGASPQQEANPKQRVNPGPTSEQMLSLILVVIQGLAQSTAADQNSMLEVVQLKVVQMIPLPGNGATSLASSSSLVPLRAQEGNQKARNGPPLVDQAKQNMASQAPRRNLSRMEPMSSIYWVVDPIKVENSINNMETTFRVMQVAHRHKTRIATTILQEEANHWWQSMEKPTYNRREITSITWGELVTFFNEQYFLEPIIQEKALEFNNSSWEYDSVQKLLKYSYNWTYFPLDQWKMRRLDAVNFSGSFCLN